jgi:hypothetical protein
MYLMFAIQTNRTSGTLRTKVAMMTTPITRDKDGDWVFPDGMCQTVTEANVGYGPDEEVPCGAPATFAIRYELFIPYDPETGDEDLWVKCTEHACDEHKNQTVSHANEHPQEMQIIAIIPMPDNSDRADVVGKSGNTGNGVDWYSWYQKLPMTGNQD